MSTQDPLSKKVAHTNPLRNHRVQSFWQIWFPIVLILILAVGLFIAVIVQTETSSLELEKTQAIALVVLLLPFLLIGLFSIIMIILAIYGTSRLFAIAPFLQEASQKVDAISTTIITWSNRITIPFMVANRISSGLKKDHTSTEKE